MRIRLSTLPISLLCALALLFAHTAAAVDYTLSGFGTLGYAQSDQSYKYQRFIGKSGTFTRDSVIGAQIDARFNGEWGATIQTKIAPALNQDNRWQPSVSWLFLSYRPTNDLLIRAGKLRMPFYLNAENMDVGATYAVTRLPIELYSVSPTMDFTGASFAQSWDAGNDEVNLDGYWGKGDMPWRHYTRDTATPSWSPLRADAKGLLLSLYRNEDALRVGIHTADISFTDANQFYTNLTPATLTPPSGMTGTYYTPSGQISKITTPTFNLGADIHWKHGFRTLGEYVRRKVNGTGIGPDTESYYLTLFKEATEWTHYLTYAQINSKNLAAYQAVNSARVSALFPGTAIPAANINASQRAAADAMTMYAQYSWSLGTAYSIDKNSKLKAEWSITHTGLVSSFVDAPVGGESGGQRINTLSLAYCFMF